jgi:hybrid cluster-associated redox disulfide protein
MVGDRQGGDTIGADTLVQEVVQHYPRTIAVLIQHGLHCAGCHISPFHTIADCARQYAVGIEPLLDDLNRATLTEAQQGKPRS